MYLCNNQPEMSTSALGGKFRDQALLIEALARDLPQDWKIFVKKERIRAKGAMHGGLCFSID